jgi:ADP-ribose pyrophosphatase
MSDGLEEQILHTEHIFKGKVVDLRVHSIALSDGTEVKREVVHHPGAVGIVALAPHDHVILVRQWRTGADEVVLELPAGGLDPGEGPEDCARRELQEEVGLYPENLTFLGKYFVAASYTTEAITIFLAQGLTPSRLEGDLDERILIERLPFDTALEMSLANSIRDAKTLIGLFWAADFLGRR